MRKASPASKSGSSISAFASHKKKEKEQTVNPLQIPVQGPKVQNQKPQVGAWAAGRRDHDGRHRDDSGTLTSKLNPTIPLSESDFVHQDAALAKASKNNEFTKAPGIFLELRVKSVRVRGRAGVPLDQVPLKTRAARIAHFLRQRNWPVPQLVGDHRTATFRYRASPTGETRRYLAHIRKLLSKRFGRCDIRIEVKIVSDETLRAAGDERQAWPHGQLLVLTTKKAPGFVSEEMMRSLFTSVGSHVTRMSRHFRLSAKGDPRNGPRGNAHRQNPREITNRKEDKSIPNDPSSLEANRASGTASLVPGLNGVAHSKVHDKFAPPSRAAEARLPQSAQPLGDQYRDFPVGVLPEPVRRYVDAASQSIGCDPAYVALPLLTGLASAIGNSFELELKSTWRASSILWTAVVAESGSGKTPAFNLALRGVHAYQELLQKEYESNLNDLEREHTQVDEESTGHRGDGQKIDSMGPAPSQPQLRRIFTNDPSTAAIIEMLPQNDGAMLVAVDELHGLFGRVNRGKGGSERTQWLSMHSGERLSVDRKPWGRLQTVSIPRASVCITGGIQLEILRGAIGTKERASGLLARFLLANPPRVTKQWNDNTIDDALMSQVDELFTRLYRLQPNIIEGGLASPGCVHLSDAAKAKWVEFYNRHAEEQAALRGDLTAAWSKLEEYAARIALVLHCVRVNETQAAPADGQQLTGETMEAAIVLTEWFKYETRRVYSMLSNSSRSLDRQELIDWIKEKHQGRITARKLQQGRREFEQAAEARNALDDLVSTGVGRWEDVSSSSLGGRPTKQFVLSS